MPIGISAGAIAPRVSLPIGIPLLSAITASCTIAYVVPFDVLFDKVTVGSPAFRAVAMLGLWGVGLWLQRANKLSLGVTRLRHPIFTIGAAALIVAIWCITLDALVFRGTLFPGYAAFEKMSLTFRLIYFCARALNENVIYRLVLGPLVAWTLSKWWRAPHHALVVAMVGMVAAQLVNIGANMVPPGDLTPATASRLILRFVLPGIAWGWLYVRHGFVANEAAAITVHWFFQPMVSLAGRWMP